MIQKIIERLEELVNLIPGQLGEMNEQSFSFKPGPEKWSKKEILGHLIDSATHNHHRFIRAQLEQAPAIWYEQDHWVDKSHYQYMDKKHLIDFWVAYNRHLIHIIRHIKPKELYKTCKMKNGTELTLEFLICDYLEHLEHHVKQL